MVALIVFELASLVYGTQNVKRIVLWLVFEGVGLLFCVRSLLFLVPIRDNPFSCPGCFGWLMKSQHSLLHADVRV